MLSKRILETMITIIYVSNNKSLLLFASMNKNIKKLSDYIPEPPKNTNNSNMLNHRN